MYENIPSEIKRLKQWVCWKFVPDETRPNKKRKIPVNPYTGGQAQSNNHDTWAEYQKAVEASANFDGIGFMFANGYFGVDIDGIDAEIEEYRSGGADNLLTEFVNTLQSYTEYSVSGRGIHIICRGHLPPNGRRKGNVEMYQDGRFFIVTGNIAAPYRSIADCTQRIKPLHEKYIGGGASPTTGIVKALPLSLSDAEILKLAEKSKQGRMFADLYNGEWESYYLSQSEADMSLCNMLAFWCRRDLEMMDKLFRSSGLMREKWDRKQSGTTYGQITLKKAIASCAKVYEPKPEYSVTIGAKKPEKKIYSFDDTGNAQRFIDTFGKSVRYSYISRKWMYYDGRRWCNDVTGQVMRMVDEIVEAMRDDFEYYIDHCPEGIDIEDYEKQFMKHMKSSRSNKSKSAMLKESEHHVPILPETLDTHNHLFNTPNGIINLRTGDLKQHNPEKYISKISYVEYTDTIDCPLWDKFLNDIFAGDQELIRYIQKAVGYSLTGSTQEQCAFFCYGTGRNGKTTFLDIIAFILGDYAVNIQPETIMVRPASGGPTGDIARLKGARFVTTVEPNEGVRLNEGLLKQLTGGDKVTASYKYQDEFEFTPEFKLWMGTNHKPIIRGTDIGIWRRVHMIPFTVQIPEEQVDRHLKQKLMQESSAILKWAVDGCLLWQREGLKRPAAVEAATKEYKSEMDVVTEFLDACTVKEESGDVLAKDLYHSYKSWAQEYNEYEMNNTKFGREMSKRFNKVRRKDGWHYLGVEIINNYKEYKISFNN